MTAALPEGCPGQAFSGAGAGPWRVLSRPVWNDSASRCSGHPGSAAASSRPSTLSHTRSTNGTAPASGSSRTSRTSGPQAQHGRRLLGRGQAARGGGGRVPLLVVQRAYQVQLATAEDPEVGLAVLPSVHVDAGMVKENGDGRVKCSREGRHRSRPGFHLLDDIHPSLLLSEEPMDLPHSRPVPHWGHRARQRQHSGRQRVRHVEQPQPPRHLHPLSERPRFGQLPLVGPVPHLDAVRQPHQADHPARIRARLATPRRRRPSRGATAAAARNRLVGSGAATSSRYSSYPPASWP